MLLGNFNGFTLVFSKHYTPFGLTVSCIFDSRAGLTRQYANARTRKISFVTFSFFRSITMRNLGQTYQRINRANTMHCATPHLQFIMNFSGILLPFVPATNNKRNCGLSFCCTLLLFPRDFIFISVSLLVLLFTTFLHSTFIFIGISKQMNKGNIICVMQRGTNASAHSKKNAEKMESFKLMKSLRMWNCSIHCNYSPTNTHYILLLYFGQNTQFYAIDQFEKDSIFRKHSSVYRLYAQVQSIDS